MSTATTLSDTPPAATDAIALTAPPAATTFDFSAPLSGPSNMNALATQMTERGIANDDTLLFTEEFVDQFYKEDGTPGETCMFNGDPHVWGDVFWTYLHLLTYYYPAHPSDDVKRAAYNNIHSLRFLLPCEHCRRGFRKEILETPVEEFLESRETFIEWGIEVHTSVNKRIGKPPFNTDAMFKRILAREHVAAPATPVTPTATATPATVAAAASSAAPASKPSQHHHTQHHAKHQAPSGSTAHAHEKQEKRRSVKHNPTSSSSGAANQFVQRSELLNNRHDMQPAPAIAAAAHAKTSYSVASAPATTSTSHVVKASESLQSVRDALHRTGQLTLQQKANLQKRQRTQEAQNVKKPAECKTCGGAGKAKVPSKF